MNAADRLCRILYGRGAEIGDTIGGLDAQMLHDAYAEIERLREADKDAARYHWLRVHGELLIGEDRGIGPEWPYQDDVDAIVDAELAKMRWDRND